MRDDSSRRVVIIGGGVAGLTAAGCLRDAGIESVIVEGRSRLGGRIQTIDVDGSDTAWIDMGAAWIDDHKTNRVFHRLDAGGISVKPTWPGLTDVRTFDERTGNWLSRFRSIVAMLKFGWRMHGLRRRTTDFANLGDRIDAVLGKYPSRTDQFLFKTTAELLNGGCVDETHQNAFSKDQWEYHRYAEKTSVMIVGGYRHLIDLLAAPIDADDIFLEREVTTVRCTDSGVAVECSDGTRFAGTHVIVTVPIGVLKAEAITFEPPLPVEKQDVIDRMGVGHVEKVAMAFPSPFWRKKPGKALHFSSITDPITPQFVFIDVSDTAGATPDTPSSACLVAISAAASARATADDPPAAVKTSLTALQRMFPTTYEPPVATQVSEWSSSPFSRGVYSYPTPTTRAGDYATLGQPIHNGRVLFAGDSIVEDTYLSSVEGALVSGERAADAIINRHGH